MVQSRPFVSVIIPVFNDVEHLKICLQALEKQTYSQSLYEVVVIDNGSDKEQDIKGVVTQFKQAIAIDESLPGSYVARNQGISIAKGDVIAFTDADCIPATNWIQNGVKHLQSTPNCGLVAGKIEVYFQDDNNISPVEIYESITAFPQQKLVEKYGYGAMANVFTFKKVINNVGTLNSNLKSHGDVEWGQRVRASGYQLFYADDACVAHPARYSFEQLYKRTIRLVGGKFDLENYKANSILERNFKYFELLAKDLFSIPIALAFHLFLDSRLSGFKQRLTFSYVVLYVRSIGVWEKIRLKLGGNSARE